MQTQLEWPSGGMTGGPFFFGKGEATARARQLLQGNGICPGLAKGSDLMPGPRKMTRKNHSGVQGSQHQVPIDGDEGSRETAVRQPRLMNTASKLEVAKTRAMRIFKAIYLAGLFTLAMGLFCGELPESLRLVDDTTNDYVTDSSASAAKESEFAQEATPAERAAAAGKAQIERTGATATSLAPAPVSGKELLPLLSIRRT